MHIMLEQLEQWLTIPSEGEHLEFKEAKNRFDFEKFEDPESSSKRYVKYLPYWA